MSSRTELIGVDEWIKALEDASRTAAVGEEGLTTEEMAQETGWSVQRCRTVLKTLIRSGKVIPGAGYRQSIAGYSRRVPVFRLVRPQSVNKSVSDTKSRGSVRGRGRRGKPRACAP